MKRYLIGDVILGARRELHKDTGHNICTRLSNRENSGRDCGKPDTEYVFVLDPAGDFGRLLKESGFLFPLRAISPCGDVIARTCKSTFEGGLEEDSLAARLDTQGEEKPAAIWLPRNSALDPE